METKTSETAIESNNDKTSKRRTRNQRLSQRQRISKWLATGMSQEEIAERLGVSASTVSREVKTLKETYTQQIQQNVVELQASELTQLGAVQEAAWRAHNRTGSNESLQTVLRVVKVRSQILGLDSVPAREFELRKMELLYAVRKAVSEVITDGELLRAFADKIDEIERGNYASSLGSSNVSEIEKLSFEKPSSPVKKTKFRKVIESLET